MLEGEEIYKSRRNVVNLKDNFVFSGGNHGKFTMSKTLQSHSCKSTVGSYQLSTALQIHTLAKNSNPA